VSQTLDTCRKKCQKPRHSLAGPQSRKATSPVFNQLLQSRLEQVFGRRTAIFPTAERDQMSLSRPEFVA
jgi:hypothetical protein